jgi:hypothetical protein
MPRKPLAVVVSSLGKLPLAGHTFGVVHHLVGLRELGYEVHYVERLNEPREAYDPRSGTMTSDPSYALAYLRTTLSQFGIHDWTFLDLADRRHGSSNGGLEAALDRADFVLSIWDPTWFDELERCERRAYIDGDPMFTQVALETGVGARGHAPRHYPVLLTYGVRIGREDCTIPLAGCEWLPARPVVATSLWANTPPPPGAPVSALLHWRAGGEIEWSGRSYGHKDRQFMRFAELPRRAPQQQFVLAAGGGRVPSDELSGMGWALESPLELSLTLDRYAGFIRGSAADLGVVKDAYVESRGGWFSDRSTSFLASGRPVLHQETGFSEWLPTGEGVLVFSDLEQLVARVGELTSDYERHSRAARALAEEHFEARTVIAGMLDAAGLR